MSEQFDFNKAVEALKNGQNLTGKDGLLTPLIKQLTEAALQAELDEHLENDDPKRAGSGLAMMHDCNKKSGVGSCNDA